MDNYNYNPSSSVLALEVVLQRSGDLELDVRIQDHWSESYFERILHGVRSFIRLLLPTTARWRHLKIRSFRDGFEAFAGCSFERLRSLDIDIRRRWNGGGNKVVINLFRHATKLVELTLGCQEEIYHSIDLPWAGIRTFSTGGSGLLRLPRMLGLQELHIDVTCGAINALHESTSQWDQEGIQFFELPLLRTITVRDGTPNLAAQELSSRLRAPSPKTLILHIRKSGHWIGSLPSPFPVFHSIDSLVNLSIDFIDFTANDTIPFLSRTSSVTNLYLGPHVATLAVMKAIGLGVVVPMLQTLALHLSAWQESADAIMPLLRHRATPISAIMFAGFGPSDDSPSSREREGHRVQARLAESSARNRGITDVRFVERYSFEL